MKIETKTAEFAVAITAKVDRKVVNVTTIEVTNLAHLGRVFEAIGSATQKVAAEFEAEAPPQESDPNS